MKLNRLTRLVRDWDTKWQRWIDPNARRVLIHIRGPMNYIVMAPVYKRMSGDARVKFYLTATHEAARKAELFNETDHNVTIIRPAQAAFIKIDVCLAADFIWTSLPRGARRIQMFHGVAGKYADANDTRTESAREWDRLFFINRRRMQNFVRAGAISADSTSPRLVGMPKVDCLVDGSISRNAVLESLSIDPGRQVVLYAPTWSAHSSLVSMGREVVEGLIGAGYAVIVKLHDRSYDAKHGHSGGVNWVETLDPLLRKSGGHLATSSNSCPYLVAADAMVTDHSSVGFEYLLLDRPVVRIEVPELLAEANVNPEYVALLKNASTTVRTADEVVPAVERGLADPNQLSEARRMVAADLFHDPGNATTRAVKELYDLLELSPMENFYV